MKNHKQLPSLALHTVAGEFVSTLLLAMICGLALLASPAAQAQTFSMIHTFTGGGDGANPEAGVTYKAGILYGTAYNGGVGDGTVYEVMPFGNNWFTLPISLLPVGVHPEARVVFGPDGHPYGTTSGGGADGAGIVFDLIPPLTICKTANCSWKENVLYNFMPAPDGTNPGYGDLTWDPKGIDIYNTTTAGGAFNAGAVYELQPNGSGGWKESVIYSFSGPDGVNPQNTVIFDTSTDNYHNGSLFGTAYSGGLHGYGTVFELTPFQGRWLETNAYNFQDGSDGGYPYAGLVFDNNNPANLYGATTNGGSGGGGTVFELSPLEDTWTFAPLYSFSGGASCGPRGTLTFDTTFTNLYGTTYCDGKYSFGNVFKLTKSGDSWVYTDLYDFTGGNDGANPISNVTIGGDGNLYGTTSAGGSQGVGVVWQIKP